MQKTIWIRGLGFAAALTSQAAAEGCVERNAEEYRDRGASLAQLCVTELEKTFSEMIAGMEAERSEAATQISALKAELATMNRSLNNAVIAYHRTQDDPCPRGWSIFTPAGGRMILGAGNHSNAGVSEYPPYVESPNNGIGGEETVTLTVAQMPAHKHVQTTGIGQSGQGPAVGVAAPGVLDVPMVATPNITRSSGSSQPHNNMPPWIALYFCVKT